jgi:hypothetical protein
MSDASVRAIDGRAVVRVGGSELLAPITAGATQSAADAADSADASAQSAAAAALAESGAVAAAGTLFPTTTAGLAATAANGFFTVVGDGTATYAILYKKVDGAAVEQARYASKAAYEGPAGAANIGTSDALGGPSAPAIHSYEQVRRLTWYGFKGNGSAIDTEAVRTAFFDAHETNLRQLVVPRGLSLIDGPVVGEDNPIPWGLTVTCEGRNPDGLYESFSRFVYSGSGSMFDIKSRTGAGARVGRLKFSGLFFQTLNPAANVFRFNDPRTFTPSDIPGSGDDDYNFISGVLFDFCGAIGVGGPTQTGDFITAQKLFELEVTAQCEMYNFRRAFDLYACDNSSLSPRTVGNGRAFHIEKSGNFGNNNKINVPYSGGVSNAGNVEDAYLVWDNCRGTRIGSGSSMLMEGAHSAAHLYLDGYGTTIDSPLFGASSKIFRLGPSGREIAMTSPRVPVTNLDWAPIIDDPSSWAYGDQQSDYRIRIYDAPLNFQNIIGAANTKGRVVMSTGATHGLGLPQADEPGIATTKGFLSPVVCTAANYWGGVGIGGMPIEGIVADIGATGDRAIKISNQQGSGFGLYTKIGGRASAALYKVNIRNRLSAAIATGSFTFIATRAPAGSTDPGVFFQALTINLGTTYGRAAPDTLDLSSWGDGDILGLELYNNGTGVGMWVDYIALTPVAD